MAEAHAHTLGRTEPVRIWRFAGTQLEMWAEVWKLALLQLLLLEFCWVKGKVSSSLLSWKEKRGWAGGPCGLIIAIIKTGMKQKLKCGHCCQGLNKSSHIWFSFQTNEQGSLKLSGLLQLSFNFKDFVQL